MRSTPPQSPSLIGLIAFTAFFGWAALQTAPLIDRGQVQWLPAACTAIATLAGLSAAIETLNAVANVLDWWRARTPTGREGTSGWATLKSIKIELVRSQTGPFWGRMAGSRKPLFIDFVSNAYVVGPAGSGKGHTSVVPMILAIQSSKIITDFKPELLCICKKALEQMGQRVIALNPFGKYVDLVGLSDHLNPLDIITDCLFRSGGLRDVLEDVGELTFQLYPEPTGGSGDDQFWRNGARKIMLLAILMQVCCDEYDATLADAARLVESREQYECRLRTFAGVDNDNRPHPGGALPLELCDWAKLHAPKDVSLFIETVRSRAKSLLRLMSGDDEKMFNSFAQGAEMALEPFAFGQLSKAMGRTTFDFDQIKGGDQPLAIFMVGDAAKTKATETFFGLMQWTMQLKLKRHANKDACVYLINDEANNYTVFGLTELMSWGRGYGIRILQYLQNYSAYTARHGQHALEVLKSESEIKLLLPGQRLDSTLKETSTALGQTSVMADQYSGNLQAGQQASISERARPLMTDDEIRRAEHGILIVRGHKPIKQIPISYSEVAPWRTMADINPHHGKPFLRRVKLRLRGWKRHNSRSAQ